MWKEKYLQVFSKYIFLLEIQWKISPQVLNFTRFWGFLILIKFYLPLKVRAGVEMALIDAVANSIGIPLCRLFGGVSNTITTDITVQFLPNCFFLEKISFSFLQFLMAITSSYFLYREFSFIKPCLGRLGNNKKLLGCSWCFNLGYSAL